ncbi:MAG: DUF177 domain-containing protein [Anaerolineales bacterium]|nr:DUF177 domain-containing protein [Anaerolineales bacterium]
MFVTRTAQGLLVKIVLRANVFSQCVRCLADFSQPLEADFTELYAFAANSITDSGLLLPENGIIDLGPIVREEMLLAIPISSVCRPDCKGLCPVCGENLNETECHHDGEDIDLRLSVLKSLLKDN